MPSARILVFYPPIITTSTDEKSGPCYVKTTVIDTLSKTAILEVIAPDERTLTSAIDDVKAKLPFGYDLRVDRER
jgi:hypothetical protein